MILLHSYLLQIVSNISKKLTTVIDFTFEETKQRIFDILHRPLELWNTLKQHFSLRHQEVYDATHLHIYSMKGILQKYHNISCQHLRFTAGVKSGKSDCL